MTIVCSQGHQNPDGSMFCDECGEALSQPMSQPAAQSYGPPMGQPAAQPMGAPRRRRLHAACPALRPPGHRA